MVFSGDRKKLEELIQLAVNHLRKAEEIKEMLEYSCSFLADLYIIAKKYDEADYYFQKELSKDLPPGPKQLLHLRYGNFQFFQMKRQDKAIYHYMEGVKIKKKTIPQKKMREKLQRIALRRLHEDESDSEALHILAFLQENGGGQQADKDSERGVDSANQVPSASLDEAGAEY